MGQRWTIQRTTLLREDAQLRWDLAYQCLLKWAQMTAVCQVRLGQEAQDENSDICPGIHAGTGRDPDD